MQQASKSEAAHANYGNPNNHDVYDLRFVPHHLDMIKTSGKQLKGCKGHPSFFQLDNAIWAKRKESVFLFCQ